MHSEAEERIRTVNASRHGFWDMRAPLLLGGIIALGTLLRLYALGRKSFWLDEIASVAISLRSASFWGWVWHHEGNMALYYVLLKPWLHFGLSESSVRLLSVIPGILTIPATYLVATRLFSRDVGLISALLMSLSPCDVVYSQEARGYSLLVLAVACSTYLFVRLVERPSARNACAYGVVAALTCYCHYFGILAIAAHFLSLFALPWRRAPWKQLALAAILIAILVSPVLWMIRSQDQNHLAWLGKPSLIELYHLGVFLAAEGGKFVGGLLLALELAFLVLFFRAMGHLGKEETKEVWHYALVVSGVLAPIVLSLMFSVFEPLFFHRFLIICLPAWLLMIAVGLASIAARRSRIAAIGAVCLLSLVCILQSYSRVREDWRGVARFLIANARSGDRVLYYEPVGYFAAESYRDWLPGGASNRPLGVLVGADDLVRRQQTDDPDRIWLVHYPSNQHDERLHALQEELQNSYGPSSTAEFRAVDITEYLRK